MIIEINGGLTNRLHVLGSIMISEIGRDCKIVWNRKPGIMARFQDLFTNTRINICEDDTGCTITNNYNPEDSKQPPLGRGEWKYCSNYPIKFEDTVRLDNHTELCKRMEWLRTLKPVAVVEDLIKQYNDVMCQTYPKWYGIQVRRGIGVNYNLESCILTPTQYIVQFMNTLEHDHNFFVASDSYYDLERIRYEFGDRCTIIREFHEYPVDCGFSVEGLHRALAELYLLGKTKKIYIASGSGYGKYAGWLANVECEEMFDKNMCSYKKRVAHDKRIGLF